MPGLEEGTKIVKDLRKALKSMRPYIRNAEPLRTGREFTNFSLLPREIWGNLLLSIALSEVNNQNITFAESKEGDGFIINIDSGYIMPTEHVSALENEHNPLPKGEERIIQAIDQKIERGEEYAEGKWLVVFFDGAGSFYRNKIRENIYGRHNFVSVICIGLLTIEDGAYNYLITEFRDSYGNQSKNFKLTINKDFDDWEVKQIMK